MNNKPGMAEDFVLNGNCQTTQDPILKEQLCQTIQPSISSSNENDLPRVGGSSIFYALAFGLIVAVLYYIIRKKR